METDASFYQLCSLLKTHRKLADVQQKGCCRIWSGRARDIIQQFTAEHNYDWQVEVREVQIKSCLFHTFLRLILNDESYVLDGTGVSSYAEYYGPESEAPAHLLDSNRDWIDYY
jgi:hypothetical protein